MLAAHYDSKWFEEGEFSGATDSSVPCTMLLDFALLLERLSQAPDFRLPWNHQGVTTIQLIFFDGEEAFMQWSEHDSIYGARHLAKKWSLMCAPRRPALGTDGSLTDDIDLFLLLDLIGHAQPEFHDFYPSTHHHYEKLRRWNAWWMRRRLLKSRLAKSGTSFFVRKKDDSLPLDAGHMLIDDDHAPFYRLRVPILHLISYPFPRVWHTLEDNAQHLDLDTVQDISVILHSFLIFDYLQWRIPLSLLKSDGQSGFEDEDLDF